MPRGKILNFERHHLRKLVVRQRLRNTPFRGLFRVHPNGFINCGEQQLLKLSASFVIFIVTIHRS